jgi:hypothetical protein
MGPIDLHRDNHAHELPGIGDVAGLTGTRISRTSNVDGSDMDTPRRPWMGPLGVDDHHASTKSPQQMARDQRYQELEKQRAERNEVMRRRLALVDERAKQAKDAELQREAELEEKRKVFLSLSNPCHLSLIVYQHQLFMSPMIGSTSQTN